MSAAHPQIAKLGELLARDFDPKGETIAAAYDLEIEQVKADSKAVLIQPGQNEAARRLAIDAKKLSFDGERRVTTVFPRVKGAAAKIVSAHGRLANLLVSDHFSIGEI